MKSPDYKDFEPKTKEEIEADKLKKKNLAGSGVRWWLAPDELLPASVMTQCAAIIQSDRGRIDAYNTYAKMYGTFTPTFWNGYQLTNSGRPQAPMRERLTYNIAQSCVDTLTSLLVENKPKPQFLTNAGNSKVQRRAKKLDQYAYGLFYEQGVYQDAPKIFRDCAVFGEGIYHPFTDNGQVKFERVLPYEILTDYLESHYGPKSTKTLHRVRNIDRTEFAEQHPDKRDEIMRLSGTAYFIAASNRSVGDTITVVESWRLPVGNRPGLHTVVTDSSIIEKEEYNESFFPFAIMRYNPRLYGFYAQGMVEQLVPIQVEINRTLISIQRSLYQGGTHKIFVKAGSRIIKSHFDNMVGTILEYAGDTPPQYVVPQLVQPEIYAHLNSMVGMGYQLPGISQMGATSMKTPGVNSGKAMRTEQNIHTQRHETVDQMYQQWFIDLARICISVERKNMEKGIPRNVKVPGKRFIETIKWKDVDLDDDQFCLQIFPVSKLPTDPEGRLATISDYMQANLIDPQVGRRLLDNPDLDAEENLANASADYLHKILDDIVDSGKYTAPQGDDDLVKAKGLVLEYINQGKLNNLAKDRLEMLRTFNKQLDAAMIPPAPTMPPPGQGPQGPAPANPLPPPTSELLPNVNQGAAVGS